MDLKDKNLIMLMADITKMFHTEMKRRVNEDSKMVTYRPILRMLEFHDGCNQLDIVNHTMLKAPTISLTLRNMEYEGLIERKASLEDKRSVNIYITSKGRLLNEKMHVLCEKLKEEILCNISEEENETCKNILIKIIKNLEELQ